MTSFWQLPAAVLALLLVVAGFVAAIEIMAAAAGRHDSLIVPWHGWYRDAIAAPDDPAHPKTMLGAEQLAWLEQALAASDATWKVIVCSVPLSIPTGSVTGSTGNC